VEIVAALATRIPMNFHEFVHELQIELTIMKKINEKFVLINDNSCNAVGNKKYSTLIHVEPQTLA